MIVGTNGQPLHTDDDTAAADAQQQRMNGILKTVVGIFQENKVTLDEGADIGINLMLNFVKVQGDTEAMANVANVLNARWMHACQRKIDEMATMEKTRAGLVAGNDRNMPS